ncbi:hypothetical protein JKP88DRAFT_263029 [Tribonema minus]|uniref:Right handed beta helix domain-containing protein n=1 Tax=Tribonema minus TaxID=303371 RepID=A0A836CH48_9STRA|nr:hypothetical protein JKP88DRAFT_263029 [Tribonema minus]
MLRNSCAEVLCTYPLLWRGGAIYNHGDRMTIVKSTFEHNRAGGGAIFNAGGADTMIVNSTFHDNQAGSGAIINKKGHVMMITNSRFSHNTARGGAIFNDKCNMTAANSMFTKNTALCGVIFSERNDLTVANSTFSSNSAGDCAVCNATAGYVSMGSYQCGQCTGAAEAASTIALILAGLVAAAAVAYLLPAHGGHALHDHHATSSWRSAQLRVKRSCGKFKFNSNFLRVPIVVAQIQEWSSRQYSWYLRADYSIVCYDKRYWSYAAYAAVMVLVYPVGIPILYAYVIRRKRCVNLERKRHSDNDTSTAPVLNGIGKSSFLIASSFVWDQYTDEADCVNALLLKVDVSADNAQSQVVIGILLITLSVVLIGAVVVSSLYGVAVELNARTSLRNVSEAGERARRSRSSTTVHQTLLVLPNRAPLHSDNVLL